MKLRIHGYVAMEESQTALPRFAERDSLVLNGRPTGASRIAR